VPPRLFFRRLFAFIVDFVIATLLAVILTLPLARIAPDKVEIGSLTLGTSECRAINRSSLQGLDPSATAGFLCRHTSLLTGQYTYDLISIRSQTVTSETNRQISTSSQVVRPVNAQGAPTLRLALDQILAPILLMVGSILLGQRKGTPGKRLLGIIVAGHGCLACRELRRFGPVVVLQFMVIFVEILAVEGLLDFNALTVGAAVVASTLLGLGLGWYYIWPFLRWTGAHRWDRATGFTVTRTG